ncbi:MAG: hypothetical protein JRF52_14055, partial [Deltaproteobacteria bacterium]|nr:hypothetical protein [Deltaproteobacteria bacterium]
MGSLLGLREYLDESYNISVFDQAFESQEPWEFHLHNHRIIRSKVHENSRYDLRLSAKEKDEELLPKTDVKLLYPADL